MSTNAIIENDYHWNVESARFWQSLVPGLIFCVLLWGSFDLRPSHFLLSYFAQPLNLCRPRYGFSGSRACSGDWKVLCRCFGIPLKSVQVFRDGIGGEDHDAASQTTAPLGCGEDSSAWIIGTGVLSMRRGGGVIDFDDPFSRMFFIFRGEGDWVAGDHHGMS